MTSSPTVPPTTAATQPFGRGSVALGLHPQTHLNGYQQAELLVEQGMAAEEAGFDGVTLSEHHGGFPSYMPQPMLLANWVLGETRRLWAGPGPLLITLRNPRLVAEEVAWTAAKFPGRVGLVLAPGYVQSDFEAMGEPFARVQGFEADVSSMLAALSLDGPLAADAAVAAWAKAKPPVLLAGSSTPSIERAARLGVGIVFPGGQNPDRHGRLAQLYRESGGSGPVCGIRVIWVGEPPRTEQAARQDRAYEAAGAKVDQSERRTTGTVAELVDSLSDWATRSAIDAVNLRIHVAGASRSQIADQIAEVGESLVPQLRSMLVVP